MGQPRGAPAPGSVRRVGVAVVSLCLVQFMDVVGVTVVVTSLPAMLASLHAPESFGSLIATGYAMFFGGLLMLGARLGDRYGHRRTILASLAVFTVGALMAATAPSVLALAAGRCLQGAAAAASVPSALRLLTTLTEEGRARHRAIAAWSAAGAAAPSGRGPPRPAAGLLYPAARPPRPGPGPTPPSAGVPAPGPSGRMLAMADQIALRPVVEDDLAMLEELTGDDPAKTSEFGWYGWRDNRRWRREWAENGLFSDDGGVLVVVRGGERLGIMNWRRKHATPAAYHWEIGIALLPEARGHGYGTEAHRLLVRYLFAHTPVYRIEAATEADNLAEQRALEKAGFTREGLLRGIGWRDGAWRDGVWFSVLRTDLGG